MAHRQQCTAPGYFVELYIREKPMESNESKDSCPDYAKTKALPVNFNWSSMPMLTVVTGINGVGKTALLQSILLAHPHSSGEVPTDRNIFIKIKDNECIVDDTDLIKILLDAMINEIEKADNISISNTLIESMQAEVREKVERNLAEKYPIIYYATIPDERPDPEMWYWLPKNREDTLIQYIRDRGSIGQRQNSRYEHLINYLDNVKKNQPEDDPMKKFYEFRVFYINRCVFYPIRCMRSANIILYLLSMTTTKDKLNEFLEKKDSKYIIDSVNHGAKIYNFDVLVTNRFDKRTTNLHLLSPGEEFHLLSLLLQYDYEVSSSTEINSPAILLLDEPDAHLHPSCIKDFMQCIVKLVAIRKLQIIMITHKATTVRYVPFDECLFIMNRDVQTDCVNIDRAMNKNQAIQLLTSNVVQINENFRLIFVEAFEDKRFYTTVLNHLNKSKCLRGIHPLLFECYGNLVKPKYDNQQFNKISNRRFVDTADRKHVIDLVKKLVNSDSDDDLSLQNFIYGLIDGDNLVENKLLEKYNILTLDRYSIENYIFDPIHVFFYLVNELNHHKDHKSNETLKKIQDIITQLKMGYSDTVISDTIKQTNALSILQKIIDCISELFTNALNDILKLKNSKNGEYKRVIESLRATRNDTNSNLTTNNTDNERKEVTLVDKDDNLINNGVYKVTIVNNIDSSIILEYPVLLLKIQGHSAETIYGKVHSSLRMGNMLKFIEKQMIIPEDLLKAFIKLSNAELTKSVAISTNTLQTTTTANMSLSYVVGYQVTPTSTTTLSPYTSSALGKTGTQTKYSSSPPVHSPNTKDICIADGYLKTVRIQEMSEDTRHLPSQFEWSNIPMLSVITGVNGTGKTAVLYSIFYKHRALSEFSVAKNVILVFNPLNEIGDIFLHSETTESIPPRLREDPDLYDILQPNCTMIASFSNSILIKRPHNDKLFIERRDIYNFPKFIHNPIAIFTNIEYFIKFIYEVSSSNVDELNIYLAQKQFKYCISIKEHKSHYFSLTKDNIEGLVLSERNEIIPDEDTHIAYFESISDCSNAKGESLANFLKTLIERSQITSTEINTYLQRFNCSFTENTYMELEIIFINCINSSNIAHHCLSSGERFTLLNLLLNFPRCAEFLQDKLKLGSILLLDEPDAHLHPSLIKDFMEYIYTLVNEYKIQIIMTTHSPETVALIRKENKRSLFVMDLDPNTNQVHIKQAVNKYQAIRLLTSDVIQINDSFRLVFVESPSDKLFYDYINSYVMKKQFLDNVQQLIFRYHSPGILEKTNKKLVANKTIEVGYFNHVQRLVEKFTTVCGENKPLENFVYGLVNQDYIEYLEPFRRKNCNNPYKQKYNVIAVNRCSSINYILDPIHIYCYGLTHNKLTVYNGEELTVLLNPNCDSDYKLLQNIINKLFSPVDFPNTENVHFQNFCLKYPSKVLNWDEADLIKHYNESPCFSNLNLKLDDVFDFLKNNGMLIPLDLLDAFDYLNSEDPQNHGCHEKLVTRKNKI